ncbi:NAD dependent epimerase/dehydratase family protein [Rhexocercosporidium sp. MPI-PUGE-AT-0058]|nr:NAD dependent epimerase/dehydratase family protein [Rhexocercosporidium sp. MPI-PUGE-AT-0058]
MPKHVLVTGSSGHLGTALMLTLPSLGYTPIGIDILPSPTTTIIGSITSPSFVIGLFTQYTFHSVLHTATLHKPHVGTHSKSQFIDVNITGTTILLEHAAAAGCKSFIFTSSTTTFGRALAPKPGEPAAWIDERVVPQPKNIYGVTKVCAEDVCELVHRQTGMPVIVLRTSRFFPEEDDVLERREGWSDGNLKANELTYRRVDIADVVSAHICAMERAQEGTVSWGRYIVSAPTPFLNSPETLKLLDCDANEALRRVVPGFAEVYGRVGWRFLGRVDRVYDSGKAVRELGWKPEWTFERAVERVGKGEEWRSELSLKVGKRGYHDVPTGVYTTAIGSGAGGVPA